MHYQSRHFASMWLRSFILDYLDGVGRLSDTTMLPAAEPMMSITVLLRYSIIRLSVFSCSVILLIGSTLGCGSPTISPSVLANTPAARGQDSGLNEISSPMSSSLSTSLGNNQQVTIEAPSG